MIIKALFKKTRFGKALDDINTYSLDVFSLEKANSYLFHSIINNQIFMCSRLGYSECWGAMHQKAKELFPFFYKFPKETVKFLSVNAGMFSTDFLGRHYFKKQLLHSVRDGDYLCRIGFPLENYIIGTYKNNDAFVFDWNVLFAFNLYNINNPWTLALEGKKVLVISSFTNSIEKQYRIIDKIYPKKTILPPFKLITYKPPITFANENHHYKSWKQALNKMKEDISQIDFDVALLSCGSYGMPLQSFIKNKLHKSSIYFGGAIEMLFGIITKRDEEEYDMSPLYNEHWKRPDDNETIKNKDLIDNGAYW